MRKCVFVLFIVFSASRLSSQITEMNWSLDYKIYMKMANDSNYVYDIRDAFHVTHSKEDINSNYVFYPATPGADFVSKMPVDSAKVPYKTLWSALHAKLGGGWIHFSNCIAYSLETKKLDLTSPLMLRPQSSWKPSPMTESYKRTKKWKYYVPVNQKLAQKEYKIADAKGELGDIRSLPQSYVDLFLNTSQKKYDRLKVEHKFNTIAKIDLVKLLLGSKYLSEAQISFISNSVLGSVLAYTNNMLPSVIIFDEFDAAAVMSLDTDGYKIEKIVYKSSAGISDEEATRRNEQIRQIVQKINDYNTSSFKKQLGNYYNN